MLEHNGGIDEGLLHRLANSASDDRILHRGRSPGDTVGGDLTQHVALVANSGWTIDRHHGSKIALYIEKGWRVSAIADYRRGGADIIRTLGAEPLDVQIENCGTGLISNARCVRQLIDVLRTLQPDLVHCIGVKAMAQAGLAAKLAGIKAVHTVTGQEIMAERRGVRLAMLAAFRYLLRGAHVIFENREDLEIFAARGLVDCKRIVQIPGCGVDIAAFGEPPERPNPTHFVMASRMLWSKGVREFVDAARLVTLSYPQARFSLFGECFESPHRINPDFVPLDWLEELNNEGTVHWHGRVDPDVVERTLLSEDTAAAVLLSRYGEGIPRFLIEAAACGLPIITTDASGCREVNSGWLCDRDDPIKEATGAMKLLFEEPAIAAEIGARSREIAMRFDVASIADQTLRVYADALAD